MEVGERRLLRRDFIRASSKHKEARQKLDYWEMEVSCRVTAAVCVCVCERLAWGGGVPTLR